ncbi:hypothetical protein PC116_g25553 [Phytophthora cactorum]|nr:hypothetical protein PI125_g25893 [Phytophthora idaei]KAG3090155.1 hypothetical protein PI125_g17771 [Phytophthora idaei]KAG4226041.1 hypothetical protein PC116_g25553 [Phytophthora cactorum]
MGPSLKPFMNVTTLVASSIGLVTMFETKYRARWA